MMMVTAAVVDDHEARRGRQRDRDHEQHDLHQPHGMAPPSLRSRSGASPASVFTSAFTVVAPGLLATLPPALLPMLLPAPAPRGGPPGRLLVVPVPPAMGRPAIVPHGHGQDGSRDVFR